MPTATTTIRIPEKMKARIARIAKKSGTTAHAFILEAIAQKTEMAERYAAFHKEADERYAEFVETGMAVGSDAMKAYARARAAGRPAARPVARKVD